MSDCSHPLVLTKRSETVEKAYLRYSMTGYYIQKLYQELPWDKKSAIQQVNAYHSNASMLSRRQDRSSLKK